MAKQKKKTPKKKQRKGLGDLVEDTLKATGVDKVAKFVLGEDCGCEERKNALNVMFPFKQVECLTETEHDWLTELYSKPINTINVATQDQLLKIYNRVFHKKTKRSGCGKCVKAKINELKKVYNEY